MEDELVELSIDIEAAGLGIVLGFFYQKGLRPATPIPHDVQYTVCAKVPRSEAAIVKATLDNITHH